MGIMQFILPVSWVGERVKLDKFLCKWNNFFLINCKMSWIQRVSFHGRSEKTAAWSLLWRQADSHEHRQALQAIIKMMAPGGPLHSPHLLNQESESLNAGAQCETAWNPLSCMGRGRNHAISAHTNNMCKAYPVGNSRFLFSLC